MLKSFLVFTLLAAFLSACPSTETIESTRVAASDVYQSYSISASRRQTSVHAVFRLNNETGKTIDLDAPAKIELNGNLMTELAPGYLSGTNYEARTGDFVPRQQFAFTDAKGKVYRNEIVLQALEIAAPKIVLSRARDSVFKLSRAVAPDERISVSVNGKAISDKESFSKTVEAKLDEIARECFDCAGKPERVYGGRGDGRSNGRKKGNAQTNDAERRLSSLHLSIGGSRGENHEIILQK